MYHIDNKFIYLGYMEAERFKKGHYQSIIPDENAIESVNPVLEKIIKTLQSQFQAKIPQPYDHILGKSCHSSSRLSLAVGQTFLNQRLETLGLARSPTLPFTPETGDSGVLALLDQINWRRHPLISKLEETTKEKEDKPQEDLLRNFVCNQLYKLLASGTKM